MDIDRVQSATWRGWQGDFRSALIGLALVPVLFYAIGCGVMAVAIVAGDDRVFTTPTSVNPLFP